MLYFASVITLLVKETNRYYHQYLDTLNDGPSPLPDITESEMFLFLAIIIQMRHDIWDSLADYWSTIEQFLTPFRGTTMKRDRFFHIIRFLHFSNNDNAADKNDPKHDRLWRLRNVIDSLNDAYSKFFTSFEHLAVDGIIVNFKQYMLKKDKRFGIKICKLCDKTGYTYDMEVYLGKDRTRATADMTTTHAIVKCLFGGGGEERKKDGCGYVEKVVHGQLLFLS
jgi:hypothetical protein